MLIGDLRKQCEEAGEYIVLNMPPPCGRGYTRRLCVTYGPRGKIISGHPDRGQVVLFKTADVLRCLDKHE
jgi:hypothetical protein